MPDSESTSSWLSSVEDVRAWRDELDAAGKKLVFTNGCFDILHAGHVRYLREARELGDGMVIAMNSDASTRALKGPTRPINHEEDRAEVLAALGCVDKVVLFEDPRATGLIEAIKPHIYSKGGDYTVESLNAEERSALDKVGAEICILPLVPGRSTTATIKRMNVPVSNKLRLGILGSGYGSNFEAILKAIKSRSLDAEIAVVMSDVEDSRILEKAREAGLPAIFVDPGTHPLRLPSGPQKEILDHLERHGVQVVVLAGFMRLLKEPVLSAYRDRIVNIHPSLLPKYKGRDAWVQALEAGETEAGCTVHLVNEDLDGGEILAQQAVPILPRDTSETLLARIHEAEHGLLPKVLGEWKSSGRKID
ncbi:phosphoribosylglycinamide formyltransferase [Phragmitibacter flavus]|uniref:phosphoribosylglycinamide formyltransferase n=1 Tax=Phragmitibacter flavus TaxID=2576071 RepID=UPI001F110D73|nr:phosphoribosylglycinamide formyltransferase [Phragmitibacter flavus]